jgi:hypothetical protein
MVQPEFRCRSDIYNQIRQYSAGSRADSDGVLESIQSLLHLPITFMQTINRFLYGPTPEERVRVWQAKLRQESRVLDREMRQVRPLATKDRTRVLTSVLAGH